MDIVVPDWVWQLPLYAIVFILIATGVLVTKREHNNMVKLMEYFRGLSDTKDTIIQNQSEALSALKEAGLLSGKAVTELREIASSKEAQDDISTS